MIAFLFASLWALDAAASVRSCILDGGGTIERRMCGIERYSKSVRSAESSADYTEDLFSGDGADPAPDCRDKSMLVKKTDGSGYEILQDTSMDHFDRNSVLTAANAKSHVYGGQREVLNKECWKNAGPTDVCHFWSSNHGRPDGLVLFEKDLDRDAYKPEEFRELMSARKCGTYRFVLNNCNSGVMMESIFAQSGQLLPNRCGATATPAYQVSHGNAEMPPKTTGKTVAGRAVFSANPIYNYTEQFSEGLKKSIGKSLDEANFYALKGDGRPEQPNLTSDFYLNKKVDTRQYKINGKIAFADKLHETQYRINETLRQAQACYGDLSTVDFKTVKGLDQQVSILVSAGALAAPQPPQLAMAAADLSDSELKDLQGDFKALQAQIKDYTLWMCDNPDFESAFGKDCKSQPEAEKLKTVRKYYQETFLTRRQALLAAYTDCLKKYSNYGSSAPEFEESCADAGRKLERFYSNETFTRRLDFLYNRAAQLLKFYQSAPAGQIREYLALRKCETSPFSDGVPRT